LIARHDCGTTDAPDRLAPLTPDDLAGALAFALRFDRRKRTQRPTRRCPFAVHFDGRQSRKRASSCADVSFMLSRLHARAADGLGDELNADGFKLK
jgi:hypothetical protein